MTFAGSTERWQRWLLATVLFGSAVLVLPPAVEPFMLPKATLVVALTIATAALWMARALWARRTSIPVSPATVAIFVFGLALSVATATSPRPLTSLIGQYGRYTGLVAYLAYLVLFLAALRLVDDQLTRLLRRTALVGLGFVVGYGLLQAAGLEPLNYASSDLGTTFSFLGNVDFSAAWAGAVTALALTTALSAREARGWRIAGAALLPLSVLYTLVTNTVQGITVAAVALAWVVLTLTTPVGGRLRQALAPQRTLVLAAAAGAAMLVVGATVAVLATARGRLAAALGERGEFYAAAGDIIADHPLLGTGLDTYGHHFQAYRPASHALTNNLATTDAPHSVPLGMFSNGGVVLGVSYLVVLALVGWALVRGLRYCQGNERIALAGFGGVWLGYQAQALISFDVPPLAVLHWLSAAVVVALGAPPRWRTVTLPGVAAARPVNKRGKPYGDIVVPASTRVLQGAVVVLALAGLWVTAYPLRADLVSASAAPLAASGRFDEAVEHFERAADLNPAEPTYALLAARGQDAAGRPELALEAAKEAARRDPGTVGYALFAAQQARLAGLETEAVRWYRESVDRDPLDPPVLNEAADYLTEAGEAAEAQTLLERSAQLRAEARTFVLLGEARLALSDEAGAKAAVERALALDPSNEAATSLATRLD